MLPSYVDRPSYKAILGGASDEYYKIGKPNSISYFEAQVHGGVKSSDIEKVTFVGKAPGKGLQAALKKNNITWETIQYEGNSN